MAEQTIRVRPQAGPTARLILGIVVAVVLLCLQNLEYWVWAWRPRTGQPAPVSIRLPAFSVYRMHLGQPADMVRRQVMVGRGEILEPNEEARLVEAHYEARARGQLGWPLGMLCVTLAAALLLLAELRRAPGPTRLLRAQVAVAGLLLLLLAGAKAYLLFTGLPPYYYPLPAAVFLAAFVFDRRVAFAINLFVSAMMASLVGFDPSVFVVLVTTGYAGTLFVRHRKKRLVVIQAGSLAGWFAAIALLVVMLVLEGTIQVTDLYNPEYSGVLAALVGGVFSGLLAWVLIGPMSWAAGNVGRGRLLDLQDLDHPILKKIREKAPGTWEHSRAMANLAEAAASAVGADSLLARVGSYVHDAGKTLEPEYFIENQSALEISNPHDKLTPEVSATCIFDHVTVGAKLLRKHGVPEAVVEFAYTHHGTSLLEYFWIKNMELGNPEQLKERDFLYPGAEPRTRETAIVMVVDAVEAASRTIKPPEKHRFEGLVQRIIFSKLSQGQLDDCGLSLADLRVVATTVVDTLVNTYHARIEYPWQKREEGGTITGTGPQPALVQTGPRPGAPPSGQEGATDPVRQTGRHAVPAEAAAPPRPLVAPRSSPRLAATGPGSAPDPAPPADRDVTETGPVLVRRVEGGGGAAGEADDGAGARRRRVHTTPGLGGPEAPTTRSDGALEPGVAVVTPSPFPPAEDPAEGVEGSAGPSGGGSAPRKVLSQGG